MTNVYVLLGYSHLDGGGTVETFIGVYDTAEKAKDRALEVNGDSFLGETGLELCPRYYRAKISRWDAASGQYVAIVEVLNLEAT